MQIGRQNAAETPWFTLGSGRARQCHGRIKDYTILLRRDFVSPNVDVKTLALLSRLLSSFNPVVDGVKSMVVRGKISPD
jgi:hypothetical protein